MSHRFSLRPFSLFWPLLLLITNSAVNRAAVQSSLNPPQEFLHMPGLKQIRRTQVKSSSLSPSGAAVMQLNLTANTAFTMSRDHVEGLQDSDTLVWYGRVEGVPYGTAVFVVNGNSVTGHVTRGDGTVYEVRTAEDGSQWTLEIDQSLFPETDDAVSIRRDDSSAPSARPANDSANAADTDTDSSSTIDILVLYTPAARIAAGGATGIQQLIQLGIAETNQGYANSGVIQRVRLVHAGEVHYSESSGGISTDLTRLRTPRDAFLEEAQTLRDTYGADLVSLWVDSPERVCGIGYELQDPTLPPSFLTQYGFNVVQQSCATGNYTFGHEMGHNMGAHHAKEDLDSDGSIPRGAYSYSNGYKNLTFTKFRTIMAYAGTCGCPRINYWSNPLVNYAGLPAGVDPDSEQSAANALTLNNTRPLVANFRPTVVPIISSDLTGPSLLVTTHGNGSTVLSPLITISGTATDAGQGDNGVSSVTVNGVPAGGDTTTATGIANWSRSLMLDAGVNTVTIVAKDNSLNHNATTRTITITLILTVSTTSNTYHVFPQFVDGVLSDGSYYRSTLMVSNRSSSDTSTCSFRLHGLTVNESDTFLFTFPPYGWTITPIASEQDFQSGYATLQCSRNVEAQLLYSAYSATGVKLSEATVLSSPPASSVEILADTRENAAIGLAIANDSDQDTIYSLNVYSGSSSLPIASTSLTLAARTNRTAFLDQLIDVPSGIYGPVTITSTEGTASVVGLRYTGNIFTAIPAVVKGTSSSTARNYHIFPQFVDGVLADGSYYRTTLMINNSGKTSSSCSLRLRGLTLNGSTVIDYGTLEPGSYVIATSDGDTQSLQSGYATLHCSENVEAQLTYSHYSPSGAKLSEATVLSSISIPPGFRGLPTPQVQILVDYREGARFALALANDSDQPVTYRAAERDVTLDPHTNLTVFLDEWSALDDFYGPVYVTGVAGTGPANVIGLRYTGEVFTTIPATIP